MEIAEWKKWRHAGLGGSDAPILMGDSPYKTPLKLYEEKILPEPPEYQPNFVADRGNRYEPKIRALYSFMVAKEFNVALLQSKEFTFQKVSLDGITPCGTEILEIKTAGREDHEGVKRGIVPIRYWAQVQHELMVSKAKVCHYVSYWDESWDEKLVIPSNIETVMVYPNPDYQAMLLESEIKFWDCIQKKKPPMPSDRDFVNVRGLAEIANKWKRLKLKEKEVSDELDELKLKLIEACKGNVRSLVNGVKVTQISREGPIDYKAIPELKTIDFEKYRKPGSTYYKVGE